MTMLSILPDVEYTDPETGVSITIRAMAETGEALPRVLGNGRLDYHPIDADPGQPLPGAIEWHQLD